MALSEPDYPREHWHTRRVECFGYRRGDGMWDIEGHIVDTKTYEFPNQSRGEPVSTKPFEPSFRVTEISSAPSMTKTPACCTSTTNPTPASTLVASTVIPLARSDTPMHQKSCNTSGRSG